MSEYNFDENKDMGETVRIDYIKAKLNEMEENPDNNSEDDYDDYEDYDEPDDSDYTDYDDDEEEYYGETEEIPPVKSVPRGRGPNGGKKRKSEDKMRLILIVIVAVLAVAVIVAAVQLASGFRSNNTETSDGDVECDYFYGVVVSVDENKYEIINTEDGKTSLYAVSENLKVTLEDGSTAVGKTVSRGDIVSFGVSKDTDEIVSIAYTDNIWEKTGFENIDIDTSKNTISNGTTKYNYNDSTLFIYNGDFISADDLCSEDVVTLKGIRNTVWSVSVEKYHGYIQLNNIDKIENPEITIDGEKVEFDDDKTAVSAGAHSLGISGSNIDQLTVDIHIAAGETYAVDMASVQEKTGVLTVSVNVDDCIIIVDGKQVEKDSPIVLSMGTYNISVSAEGYKTYSSTIAVNEPLVEEKIILEKLVQPKAMLSVESNPAGASVYANDVLIGTTPFSAQIEYGDYRITFKKDGYSDYTINTSVNEEQKTISVLLNAE